MPSIPDNAPTSPSLITRSTSFKDPISEINFSAKESPTPGISFKLNIVHFDNSR